MYLFALILLPLETFLVLMLGYLPLYTSNLSFEKLVTIYLSVSIFHLVFGYCVRKLHVPWLKKESIATQFFLKNLVSFKFSSLLYIIYGILIYSISFMIAIESLGYKDNPHRLNAKKFKNKDEQCIESHTKNEEKKIKFAPYSEIDQLLDDLDKNKAETIAISEDCSWYSNAIYIKHDNSINNFYLIEYAYAGKHDDIYFAKKKYKKEKLLKLIDKIYRHDKNWIKNLK